MKFHRPLLVALLLVTLSRAAPSVEFVITDEQGRSLETVDIDPSIPDEDPNMLDASRIKRSGSGGIIGYIKDGISSKLGQIASASAGASAHFSGSSSGSTGYSYGYGSPYEGKSFDFWTLKKSVLNSLLNAVKAIKGGVLAIKGQLIKGGGNLISAKGRLISMKGEAVSNLGKHFISTATFKPAPYHDHYVHPDEIGHAHAPHFATVDHHAPAIGTISAPVTGYGVPSTGFAQSGHTALSSNYLPIVKPSYGPPVTAYGPPVQHTVQHTQSYGGPSAPSHNYLPQKFNSALEGHYEPVYDQQHYYQYQ